MNCKWIYWMTKNPLLISGKIDIRFKINYKIQEIKKKYDTKKFRQKLVIDWKSITKGDDRNVNKNVTKILL